MTTQIRVWLGTSCSWLTYKLYKAIIKKKKIPPSPTNCLFPLCEVYCFPCTFSLLHDRSFCQCSVQYPSHIVLVWGIYRVQVRWFVGWERQQHTFNVYGVSDLLSPLILFEFPNNLVLRECIEEQPMSDSHNPYSLKDVLKRNGR